MSLRRWTLASRTSLAFGLLALPLAAQVTKRSSVDSAGVEANAQSSRPSLDRDGRFVTFQSDASNLVAADMNGVTDVFVRDRSMGITALISVNAGGVQGNGVSDTAHLAGLGGFVAFRSDATNLWPGDVNGMGDIFLRDIVGAWTEMVSVDFGGGPANGASDDPFVTANGRFVAFVSYASDLVPGDGNNLQDCFVRDRLFGVTDCISVNGAGVVNANGLSGAPSLSADGRYAAFHSYADNLVAGDMNGACDVFVRDMAAGITRRISLAPGGVEANGASLNPWISEDGRYVAYQSDATNLVAGDVNATTDVFVFDRLNLTTVLASMSTAGVLGTGPSVNPAITSDGSRVVFASDATNLVPADTNLVTDVFVRDLVLGVTHRASLGEQSTESVGASSGGAISGAGHDIAFSNAAADLVAADGNLVDDVFVRIEAVASTALYGAGFPGTLGMPFFGTLGTTVMGTSPAIQIGNSRGAATFAVLFLGLVQAQLPTPWGGDLLLQPAVVQPFLLPAGIFNVTVNVPHEERLEGLAMHLQVLELDPGAAQGVSFTPGMTLVLGW